MAANRTREIRPSGMRGGLRGNVDYGGTRILPRNRKSEVVMNLCLRLARAAILPGHPSGLPKTVRGQVFLARVMRTLESAV